MNTDPKKTYKEINGTTRVGDFLRSIGKSKVLDKVLGVTGELITGDIKGAIDVITKSDELTKEEKEYAIKMAELDLVEMQEVTKRWQSDMNSDNWLSKNIRPMSLGFMTLMFTILVILDSSIDNFIVKEEWTNMLGNLLFLAYSAYFGARTLEKVYKIRNS